MFRLVNTLFAFAALLWCSSAGAVTVAIVTPAERSPEMTEALGRLRGELSSVGFSTEFVDAPENLGELSSGNARPWLEDLAKRRDLDAVVAIVGADLPDSVEVFFEYLSEGTLAEGARLHFEIVPIEMTCQDCSEKMDLSEWKQDAPHVVMQKAFARGCVCGGKNLRVTGGVSFGLTSISVDPDPPA